LNRPDLLCAMIHGMIHLPDVRSKKLCVVYAGIGGFH